MGREGFAPTILAARQLVTHQHIRVNGEVLNIPSYQCKAGDEIQSIFALSGPEASEKRSIIRVDDLFGSARRPQIQLKIKERLVVEYYSRK